MQYAEVAVNAPVAQPRTFSYSIPEYMSLSPGQAVWVPFGSRLTQGIVFKITLEPEVEEIKPISEVIGHDPLLFPYQIELACWIAKHYLCSFFNAAVLMLPPGFTRKLLTFFHPVLDKPLNTTPALSSLQQEVLNFISKHQVIGLKAIQNALGKRNVSTTIRYLLKENLVTRTYEIEPPKIRPKIKRYLKLTKVISEGELYASIVNAPKQESLLHLIAQNGNILPVDQVKSQFSSTVVNALLHKGLISIEEIRVQRDPMADHIPQQFPAPLLTPYQENEWKKIKASMVNPANDSHVFLLHGVTGSGKTELYLRALEQAVSLGKRAIVLVPEIALTPQTIARFAARFPDKVAVLHSKLSQGEQFDEWYQIKNGAFDVVIGSRGAIFAPQPDLGLIVIDEEHELTYKQQDKSPRYHARDVAVMLSKLTGATVILGSATPDLESYYKATTGHYHLLELPERITKESKEGLPKVELIDLRKELKSGNRSIFSKSLSTAMEQTLSQKEQIILFLNRRGAATFIQCRDCGFVITCKRCQVALTYHSVEQGLICHQCNYRTQTPSTCPQCSSKRIKFLGVGTQKIAEEAGKQFPSARVLRWDHDVTREKNAHEKIMRKFLAHEADILIGTQMIAKGLDLPLVTLVGVINADIALRLPDFRAGERTFQLLTQVAGRAGRDIKQGKVIIQTYTPEHYAIVAASNQDYLSFFHKELAYRRELQNPPFSRMVRLLYTHTNADQCRNETWRMYQVLKQEIDSLGLSNTVLIGPSPCYLERLRGRFRWQIVIRGPEPNILLNHISIPREWSFDIDPVSLL